MQFEWGEAKRVKNLKKHQIDFADCAPLFDAPMLVVEDTRGDYGEVRYLGVGFPCGGHMKKNANGTAKRGKRNVKAPLKPARSATRRRTARGGTDWAAVAAKSDAEIERDIANDRDAAPIFTDEMLERAKWVQPAKAVPISLRVDPDVLEFYKAGGPGYQSRMNAVLRAYAARAKETG